MSPPPRILVVDAEPDDARAIGELCRSRSLACDLTSDGERAESLLQRGQHDVCLLADSVGAQDGLQLLQRCKQHAPDVGLIYLTEHIRKVVPAYEAGADDYFIKNSADGPKLWSKIARALAKRRVLLENRRLMTNLSQANTRIEEMNRRLEAEVEARTRELRQANARLEELSITDDVTGLYNQRFLYTRLAEEMARVRRYGTALALVMLDLDAFKLANDKHDHLFGSSVLRRCGQFLRRQVRDSDFVVRYGGDEFVLVLPHTGLPEAVRVAERVRESLMQADFGEANTPWPCTASLGVAAAEGHSTAEARSLMQAADRALYRAKTGGRNRVEAAELLRAPGGSGGPGVPASV